MMTNNSDLRVFLGIWAGIFVGDDRTWDRPSLTSLS